MERESDGSTNQSHVENWYSYHHETLDPYVEADPNCIDKQFGNMKVDKS